MLTCSLLFAFCISVSALQATAHSYSDGHLETRNDERFAVHFRPGVYFSGNQLIEALNQVIRDHFRGEPSRVFEHFGPFQETRSRLLFYFEVIPQVGHPITQNVAATMLQELTLRIGSRTECNGIEWIVVDNGHPIGRGSAIGNPSGVSVKQRYTYDPNGYPLPTLAVVLRAAAGSLATNAFEQLRQMDPHWSFMYHRAEYPALLFHVELEMGPAGSGQSLLEYNAKAALVRMASAVDHDWQRPQPGRAMGNVAGIAFPIVQAVLDARKPWTLDTQVMARVNAHMMSFGVNGTSVEASQLRTTMSTERLLELKPVGTE